MRSRLRTVRPNLPSVPCPGAAKAKEAMEIVRTGQGPLRQRLRALSGGGLDRPAVPDYARATCPTGPDRLEVTAGSVPGATTRTLRGRTFASAAGHASVVRAVRAVTSFRQGHGSATSAARRSHLNPLANLVSPPPSRTRPSTSLRGS